MKKVTLIPAPVWARPFERSIDPNFGELECAKILKDYESVIEVFCAAIQGYINDDSLTYELSEQGFPVRGRLTGEYYIASESYWVSYEPWFERVGRSREYRFSIHAHCLEHKRSKIIDDQDYLGLEVHFTWDCQIGQFFHHGDVDSSSI